jgi:23S rRNA (cytidine1920-2'-O)/16S rRNA (cytidine1409-2'-O)-methyltransferase
MVKRLRLDHFLIDKGMFASRESARAAIMDGSVLVNGQKVTKAGKGIDPLDKVELIPSFAVPKYVGKGGLKLERAFDVFDLKAVDCICLDIGASTGGFTDCLLQHGASKVYAIDVGYGQLDWKLRTDARVRVIERSNARYLKRSDLYGDSCDLATLATIDVSFISLSIILPACLALLRDDCGQIVCLIKPQFEAGRKLVSKGGVVYSKGTQVMVINSVCETARKLNLGAIGLTHSPVIGRAGNIEFLLHLKINASDCIGPIPQIVEQAHKELLGRQNDSECAQNLSENPET